MMAKAKYGWRVIVLIALHSAWLEAATVTWDGGANTNNWSGNGSAGNNNWNPNGAPAAGDILQFDGTTRLTSTNNTAAGTSYAGITFLSTAGAFTLNGNSITLTGNVTNNSTSLQTIDLAMALSGSRTFFANSGDITVNGLMSGSGALIKAGSNILRLSAANTFTGDTVIQQGTVELTGSGALESSNIVVGDTGSSGAILSVAGGFLAKNGQTVSGIGTVISSSTYQSGSTLSPGNSGAGILTNNGNIHFQSGSLLAINLGGTSAGSQYDQLNVLGGVTLAGALSINMGSYVPNVGDKFFILTNDGTDAITGTFSNAPVNGGIYTFGGIDFMVSYSGDSGTNSNTGGNDVVLVVIPESKPLVICGIYLSLMIFRRRRR